MSKKSKPVHPELKKCYLESAGFVTMPSSAEVLELIHAADKALNRVDGVASAGNEAALRGIIELAQKAARMVSTHAMEQFDSVSEISRTHTAWPILCSANPELMRRNMQWMDVLPIGEKTMWKKPGAHRPHSITKGINAVVSSVIGGINMKADMYRRGKMKPATAAGLAISKLPNWDGSSAALDAWAEAVWLCMLDLYGPNPEIDPTLRAFGKHRAECKKDTYKEGSRAYEHNVIDGIRERIRTSLKTILSRKDSEE